MDFLFENWFMIVVWLCVLVASGFAIYKFTQLPNDEKYEQIRGWLLQAVILAEREYGSGTGKMKLSSVYDAFCRTLPWIAKTLTFETFSEYVDDALTEAKEILMENKAIASIASTMIQVEEDV